MCIRSRQVWISVRSGPKDTQSSPGSFPAVLLAKDGDHALSLG